CQNLPAHLKHRPENVFVFSIMPGPTEPKYVVNPYLKPLVKIFLLFWDTGVHFSRTCKFPTGRTVMCAIICVICDLPGARKFGGFSACTHSFYCAICLCRLPGSIKHSIDIDHAFGCWNISAWERRQYYDTVARATAFNLAPDKSSAQSSFDQSGLRYTELLELPYFDPTRFIVVDSMHNLFLGLIKEHFTNILG
ncbi:hypothetical protein PLEOSDRAFT_1015173, partial [Pleurotus ostreatus PC15]